jgi:hypothetical protein
MFHLPADLSEAPPIHAVYAALAQDPARNALIVGDVAQALAAGRSPLLLTNRTEHLACLAEQLAPVAQHLFVLKGGMGRKQRQTTMEALTVVPENGPRVLGNWELHRRRF